ncbi:MAG: small multi-drug export protein [Firmicutes bacterium]|nr:small multi-drug export protein [Bacillota bacterium]
MIENFGALFSREVLVFIVSMMPILELRGGIICGYALGMELLPNFIIAFIGNILPIPFILLFIKFIFRMLRKTPLKGIVDKLENKAMSKSDSIQKYAYWGLLLFVGIPLPGTGAWTGALIASLLNMDIKKSFVVITIGVIMAGLIITTLSYGLLSAIGIG